MNLFQRRKRKVSKIKRLFQKTLSILIGFSVLLFILLAGTQIFAQNNTECPSGVSTATSSPFSYSGSSTIGSVGIMPSGNGSCINISASNSCYTITGLGTQNVIVSKTGNGGDCKNIDKVTFYGAQPTNTLPPSPTNTPIPTNTPVPPTPTPTNTKQSESQEE